MSKLIEIPLAAITLTPHNPRRIDPADPAIAELAKSIEASGLLQPVVCRVHGDGYELLAGARRYHAHMLLKRDTILATVHKLDDAQAISVTVLENLQRQDLTPIEEGRGVASLLASGQDIRLIAEELGKTPAWVHRRAKLADLDPAFVEKVEDPDSKWHKATAGVLELFARLPAERQAKYLAYAWMATSPIGQVIEAIERDEHKLNAAVFDLDDMTLVGFACGGCFKRTDAQPDLFDDESGNDPKHARCLDPDCWGRKEGAHLKAQAQELRAEHGDKLVIVGDHRHEGKDATIQCTHRSWDVDRCKKNAPGARPALIVSGDEDGKPLVAWVRVKAGAKDPDKPKMPPLALRRKAHIVKSVQMALEKAACPFQSDRPLLACLVAFGTRDRSPWAKPDTWADAEKMTTETKDALHAAAWKQVRPTLVSRLNFQTVGDIEPHYKDALNVIDLLGLDLDTFECQAKAELPEKGQKKTEVIIVGGKACNTDIPKTRSKKSKR